MSSNLRVEGLSELRSKLLSLPQKLRDRILMSAVHDAAVVVRDEAIQRAPVWEGKLGAGHPPAGTLKKSIIAQLNKAKSNDQRITYAVRVLSGARQRTAHRTSSVFDPTTGKRIKGYRYRLTTTSVVGGAYYWWWVEFGTQFMEANPYMRPALDSSAQEAADACAQRLRDRLGEVATA